MKPSYKKKQSQQLASDAIHNKKMCNLPITWNSSVKYRFDLSMIYSQANFVLGNMQGGNKISCASASDSSKIMKHMSLNVTSMDVMQNTHLLNANA
jgi:hypothetical protein